MTTLVSRVYGGPQDLQSILDLWSAVSPPARSTVYPAMVDLHELLALKEVQDNTRLWHAADGQVVGFAIVDRYLNLLFELAPQADGHKLESQMVGWGEVCAARASSGSAGRRHHGLVVGRHVPGRQPGKRNPPGYRPQ